MQKTCQQCSTQFEIDPKDQAFYQKMNVPEPTFCPICRAIRRMSWRNDRTFYQRKCSKTGKQMISIYPPETPFPVYHPSVWYGDQWDPMEYGQELSFDRPFFDQWNGLMLKVPRLGVDIVNCENSDYCNYCGDDKNCYLDIAGEGNEDCYFNLFTKHSKNCVDCTFVYNSELMYEAINCYKCYNVKYSFYLENCHDCMFSFDLKGCSDCLFSSNLRQKQYYIFNQPYSKEAYHQKLKELKIGSHQALQENLKKWKEVIKTSIHRDMYNLNSENCIGNEINNSKNCAHVYNVSNCEDCKFLYDVLDAKNCYDLNYSLYKPELVYELISTLSMRFSAFSMASHYCNNVYYVDQCNNSSNLFGCIGLNHKQYCILNRQYSKEEYEKLLPKIIELMKNNGEWGEFFPSKFAMFGYNETVAQEYFPLTKEEALGKGYQWKDEPIKVFYDGPKAEIPDEISATTDEITQKILTCEECGKNYKIIVQELKFYQKMGLAIPRKCPSCRHKARLSMRNSRKLYARNCSKCQQPIQTTYSPGRSEKVYCEACYLKEVY